MAATLEAIVKLLDELAPQRLACDWDNVGLLLGRSDKPVARLVMALDMTPETVAQVLEQKADLLVTHHPAIFQKIGRLTADDWQQQLLLTLAENGVAVYSAHTNLDCVANGVNMALASRLELKNLFELDQESGLGRIGKTAKPYATLPEFAAFVKKALNAAYVTYADAGRTVRRVAVCGGAGADLIDLALSKGADTLLTGDVKYHQAQKAVYSGLNILDAGHQATELPVLEELADRLALRFAEHKLAITVTIAKENVLLRSI